MTDNSTRDGCGDIGAGLLRGDLPDSALRLAVDGFAALWCGRAVPVADLLGNGDQADAIITELAARGRAEIDESGRLVGIHGLTLRSTRHRLNHAGRCHNTWCAFDSIGIPAALALDATAHTDCPACGRSLTVEIGAGVPSENGFALWLPSPSGDHLMAEFCASADLYCSVEHLHQRVDTDLVPGTVADLAKAAAIGAETWADVAAMSIDAESPWP